VVEHLIVKALKSVAAGAPTIVVVAAVDNFGQVVTNYTGTIGFATSDTAATLPAPYSFSASDSGIHYFSVTFGTIGADTLTATDTSNSLLTGQTVIWVVI
jgi:hypothetical protein